MQYTIDGNFINNIKHFDKNIENFVDDNTSIYARLVAEAKDANDKLSDIRSVIIDATIAVNDADTNYKNIKSKSGIFISQEKRTALKKLNIATTKLNSAKSYEQLLETKAKLAESKVSLADANKELFDAQDLKKQIQLKITDLNANKENTLISLSKAQSNLTQAQSNLTQLRNQVQTTLTQASSSTQSTLTQASSSTQSNLTQASSSTQSNLTQKPLTGQSNLTQKPLTGQLQGYFPGLTYLTQASSSAQSNLKQASSSTQSNEELEKYLARKKFQEDLEQIAQVDVQLAQDNVKKYKATLDTQIAVIAQYKLDEDTATANELKAQIYVNNMNALEKLAQQNYDQVQQNYDLSNQKKNDKFI